jgi:hypothetical protein
MIIISVFPLSLRAVVHGHGQPNLKVLVQHLSSERHALAKHLHGHETEGLAVHEEPVRLHRGEVVHPNQAVDPPLNILTTPGAWI